MRPSLDPILVTKVGSLRRPPELLSQLLARDAGEGYDAERLTELQAREVSGIVLRQLELGIDVVGDGELGKTSFVTYVNGRLGGLEPRDAVPDGGWLNTREGRAFPAYYEWAAAATKKVVATEREFAVTGPVSCIGAEATAADIRFLQTAMAEHGAVEGFMPSIAPGDIADLQRNEFYASDEELLYAVADAMREEYQAILDAGLLLQIDAPALLTAYTMHADWSVADALRWAAVRVDALKHAMRGLPSERIRFHTCYSINQGPRKYEMELEDIVEPILEIPAGALSFEAANPRHEHEWRVWKAAQLPEDRI